MPANQGLKYFEIADFSAGVFSDPGSGDQLLMPSTGAQQLTDAYPQPMPSGGLRAFFKSVAVSTSGLSDVTKETVSGIYAVPGYSARSGAVAPTGTVRYITTFNETDGKTRVYRMDGPNGEATWHLLFTSGALVGSGNTNYSSFSHFQTTDGHDYMMLVIRAGAAADRGLYTIEYVTGVSGAGADGDVTKISSHHGALLVAQARVILGENSEAGNNETIHWTSVGTIDFSGPTSGELIPSPNGIRNDPVLMEKFDPDQILIGFSGSSWVTITGDINSPSSPVRQMGYGHFPQVLQDPVRTPDGIVFVEPNGPAYLTDGRTFQNITTQLPGIVAPLAGDGIGGIPPGAFWDGFLFMPNGYIMHEESKGWFKASDQNGVIFTPYGIGGVLSSSAGLNPTIKTRRVDKAAGQRMSAYTWRSAPFAQPDGTQSQIREVQILAECYSSSTYTITLTNEFGETQSFTTAATGVGKHNTVEPCLLTGHYMDVTVTATAASTGEAPTIEKIRLGFGDGKRL